MKVCIVGAGVVGSYLAKRLSREGFEVAVIDVDSSKLENLSYSYDVMTVNCNALDVNCLKNVQEFDLFVVVTESDEKNLSVAILLRALLNKRKVIIRVSNKAFSSPPVKEFLGVDVVNILSETVQAVLNQVKYPFALDVVRLEGEGIVILKLKLTTESPLAGKQILELSEVREKIPFTIVAIERDGKTIIPSGTNFMYPNDILYIAVKEEDAERLAEVLGIEYSPVKLIFVFGYSRFTEELLTQLSNLPVKVKFVCSNMEKCEEVSGKFPKVDVFHGEFSDIEFLKEEGIERADLTVSVTEDEEQNILSAVLCKKLGAKRTLALIMHPEYEGIVTSIGIDVPLIPRKLLASKVYRQLSRKKFVDIFELSEDLEIVEMEVPEKSTNKKVKDSGFCGLIVAVRKNGEVELARGNTFLERGDKLICIKKRES